jgi:hypothetical protein
LPIETAPLLGMKMFYFDFFGGGGGGGCGRGGGCVKSVVMVCSRWVGLCVIAEKSKIYSHLRVVKNPYPQNDS